MISLAGALKLVKSWECLPYFPRTQEGVSTLAKALISIGGSKAEKLADIVINGCPRCPTPLDLRTIMSQKLGPCADGKHAVDFDMSRFMASGGKNE